MRISDWSSDVCSSDLLLLQPAPGEGDALGAGEAALALQLRLQALLARRREALPRLQPQPLHAQHAVVALVLHIEAADPPVALHKREDVVAVQIGRAPGRERGCQYV